MSLPPANDSSMWRRLFRAQHPDVGGDEELFKWLLALRDEVGASSAPMPERSGRVSEAHFDIFRHGFEGGSANRTSTSTNATGPAFINMGPHGVRPGGFKR